MCDAGLLCHIGACGACGTSGLSHITCRPASRQNTLHIDSIFISAAHPHSHKSISGVSGTMETEAKNDYILHNHNELVRQALQHVIIKDAMNGRQVFAPIRFDVSHLEILDVCTGNGPSQPFIYPSVDTNSSRSVDSRPADCFRLPAQLHWNRHRSFIFPQKNSEQHDLSSTGHHQTMASGVDWKVRPRAPAPCACGSR